jgi:hypothetical protein
MTTLVTEHNHRGDEILIASHWEGGTELSCLTVPFINYSAQ